jgi:hypothetical protein
VSRTRQLPSATRTSFGRQAAGDAGVAARCVAALVVRGAAGAAGGAAVAAAGAGSGAARGVTVQPAASTIQATVIKAAARVRCDPGA